MGFSTAGRSWRSGIGTIEGGFLGHLSHTPSPGICLPELISPSEFFNLFSRALEPYATWGCIFPGHETEFPLNQELLACLSRSLYLPGAGW